MNFEIDHLCSQKLQSVLYQVDKSNFSTFTDMVKYLEEADSVLTDKIDNIQLKIESVRDEFIRTSSVYEMNNKKRQKQQQALRRQREYVSKQLVSHQQKLSEFTINPITLVLKQKRYQLEKLNQTKEIIQEFNKLVKGKDEDIKNILPLDDKNFNNSAMKIFVFKNLLQDIHGSEYQNAKLEINKKYTQLKNKIIQNFKQGFWNKDIKLIRKTLPYAEQYELMDEVSEFYNEQIFQSVHKITKLECQLNRDNIDRVGQQNQEGEAQIKNMFFLIEQGFNSAFNTKDQITGEENPNQIQRIMGKYAEAVGRKLVTYVFDRLIKQSLENILKTTATLSQGTSTYLAYLEIFYDESKKLLKSCQQLIKEERTLHLMSTYFQSIFDTYLDSYISKELNNLDETYQKCTMEITKQISDNALNGATQFAKDKQKNNMFADDTKKTLKRILIDFAIESKKNAFSTHNLNNINQTAQISEMMKTKIQNLLKIFMNPSLERIFYTTKKALLRNKKIAKINEIDKNRNQILQVFLSNIEQIIQNFISLISEIVPTFEERAPALQPDFFQVVPQISMLLYRIEFMYEQYKKQNYYRLADTIKVDQKKQSLMANCGKSLNKVIGQAMATILATQSYILDQDINQYNISSPNSIQSSESPCTRLLAFLERYIRAIQKISINSLRSNILKTLGLQLVNHLLSYYSSIVYSKEGLSRIFMDVAKLKTLVAQFQSPEVEARFRLLRTLIDIYVIRNDEKSIEDYLKAEGLLVDPQLKKIVESYVMNKIKCEKVEKNK